MSNWKEELAKFKKKQEKIQQRKKIVENNLKGNYDRALNSSLQNYRRLPCGKIVRKYNPANNFLKPL